MKGLKVISWLVLLLQFVIQTKAQNTCPQRNELNMHEWYDNKFVMFVRTAPGTNTIIDAHTGYSVPIGYNEDEDGPGGVCTNGPAFTFATDAHILDYNEDGEVDEDWNENVYIVFNYDIAEPYASCNTDYAPYQLSDDFFKIPLTHINNPYGRVDLPFSFSPYTEYGFCLINVFFHSRISDLPASLFPPDFWPSKSFGISMREYNNEWGDVNYHPMSRRVLKNAKTPQIRPNTDPVPGSTTPPDHWVKIDKLIRVNDSECPQSNMDDYDSRGAPFYFRPRDERNYPVSDEPYVFGHYSRSSMQNATCTDENLWFVQFNKIWNVPLLGEDGEWDHPLWVYYQTNELGLIPPTTASPDIPNDYQQNWNEVFNEGDVHFFEQMNIEQSGNYKFSHGKEVTFRTPSFVLPNGFLNSQTEFRVEKGTQVRFLNRAIREGEGLGSATLRLVSTGRSAAGRGSLLELNTCDINDVKTAIQQIRATNGGRVRINAEEGDLILGYPDPFIDQRSIVVEEDGRVDIIMGKGNLYINGGIVIEPGGELNIWVSESKKLVFTNELETIRNLKLLGALNLQAGTLEMRGNNRISGTGGRFNPRILRIEGEVGMPKAASLIVNTQETIIQNGKLVAIAEGPAGAPNGRVFIYSVTKTSVEDFSRLGPIARIKNLLRYIPTPKPNVQSMCCEDDMNYSLLQPKTLASSRYNSKNQNQKTNQSFMNKSEESIGPNIYPNPFTDQLKIRFQAKELSSRLLMQVYNEKGVLVHQQQLSVANKGMQTIVWNAGLIAKGVYFIRIVDEKGKMIVQQKAVKL